MADMTYNTLVFTGSHGDIMKLYRLIGDEIDFNKVIPLPSETASLNLKEINVWKEENWGSKWCHTTKKFIQSFGDFTVLKLFFETPWTPPHKIVNTLFEKFPLLKGIYRVTNESCWHETTIIRRDPSRGFQRCLTDNPHRFNIERDSSEGSTIDVVDEYLEELKEDSELRVISEMVGITLDRIFQRQHGLLESI